MRKSRVGFDLIEARPVRRRGVVVDAAATRQICDVAHLGTRPPGPGAANEGEEREEGEERATCMHGD